MKNNRQYKVLDLFAGIGGFSLGFKRFEMDGTRPFKIVAALEKDRNAANTLINSFINEGYPKDIASSMVINEDITSKIAKKKLYSICPEVDIIIGGPPCQSFSMIGPRSGDKKQQEKYVEDDRDNLFEHYIEIVQHYRPKIFVFENVKGILSKKKDSTKFIDLITKRFEGIGYNINVEGTDSCKYMLLNAVNYGVPQYRERVIIIGNIFNKDNPIPTTTHCSPDMSNELNLLPYVTLEDSIGDLPEVFPKLTYTPYEKIDRKNKVIPDGRKKYIDELNKTRNEGMDSAPYHWPKFITHYEKGGDARRIFLDFVKPNKIDSNLIGHKARSQQESDVELFMNMEQGMSAKDIVDSPNPKYSVLASLIKYNMESFKDKYKKLSWNEPSNTIIAHLQKDGNRYIHPDSKQGRTLTVREAARLQSFPDDYEIYAVGNTRYKYIGNAVPPLLSKAIAHVVFCLLKEENH